jgi:hypothetical protein
VSFDGSGTVLAASGTDGVVYFYSLSSEEPRLLKKVDGLIKNLESDVEASSKIVWHPSGGAFGAATVTRGEYCDPSLASLTGYRFPGRLAGRLGASEGV